MPHIMKSPANSCQNIVKSNLIDFPIGLSQTSGKSCEIKMAHH